MITCPLCHLNVLPSFDAPDYSGIAKTGLHDNEIDDFYCPTIISFHQTLRSHFTRFTRQTWQGNPEYRLLVPPFQLLWMDGQKTLRVFQHAQNYDHQDNWDSLASNVEFHEVVRLAQRLNNLKAFL